jgi:hypothetical protein
MDRIVPLQIGSIHAIINVARILRRQNQAFVPYLMSAGFDFRLFG